MNIEKENLSQQIMRTNSVTQKQEILEQVPVHLSNLMAGFQSALVKANRRAKTGVQDLEDIGEMAIGNLEVQLSAPIIDRLHPEDPVIMLPNIKSVTEQSPKVTLKFNVVALPSESDGVND